MKNDEQLEPNPELLAFCREHSKTVSNEFALLGLFFLGLATLGVAWVAFLATLLVARNSELSQEDMRNMLSLLKTEGEQKLVKDIHCFRKNKFLYKDLGPLERYLVDINDKDFKAHVERSLGVCPA